MIHSNFEYRLADATYETLCIEPNECFGNRKLNTSKRKILSGYREYIFRQDDHIERDIYNERDYIAFGQCK